MEAKTQTKPVVKTQTTTKPVTKTVVQVKPTTQPKIAQTKTTVTSKPVISAQKTIQKPPTQKLAPVGTPTKVASKTQPQAVTTKTAPVVQNKVVQTKTNTKVTTNKQTPAKQQVAQKPVEKKVQTEEQKTKNAIELIGIFKKLEKNLVDVLQTIPQNVEDEGKESVIADIKSFKNKVELARKIFDEYENTSNLITQMIEAEKNDKDSIEISKKVIEPTDKSQKSKINEKDLFKQVQSMEKQTKGLDKIEIEAVGDTVVVKKKSALGREPEYRKN